MGGCTYVEALAAHAVNYLANVAADPLYGSYGAVKSISNTPDFFAASVREEAHHSPNIRTMGQVERTSLPITEMWRW
ncbi:hypothetical protein J14TS5_10410 [Paenibacillus lautus]|uniref:hypothetical protein n=1 Tax=Paenibacillus lautus TaxID=1401 RepID=UPI001B0041FF|nr:hypothetical protein [Paenibacillus lautus]GIO95955.1 hypothetical protein J14TS5_10410 [Paenibacillus lautus]